jgi:hypothetical protein
LEYWIKKENKHFQRTKKKKKKKKSAMWDEIKLHFITTVKKIIWIHAIHTYISAEINKEKKIHKCEDKIDMELYLLKTIVMNIWLNKTISLTLKWMLKNEILIHIKISKYYEE